jgi:polyhydroxyalkanoate synthesis regulator phasin
MKAKRIIVILAVLVLGFSTFSFAEGIDYRVRQAHEQIERGIKSGALTRDEARRLENELNSVLDDEARMKADGRLNRYERERLEKELDRLERYIASLKSDDDRKDRDGRRDKHQQRWSICANEGEYCKFKGQKSIRYGAGERWNYQTARNGISCSNKVFGDPASGVHKACYIEED